MKYDIIIIGAGLGGLTAGAKLAKQGKKVLLIEQHDRPGGCATTFERKDFVFEVGLHEMDGLDRRDMKTKIFRDLGVFDKVEFLKVPEFYHFVNDRYKITIPHEAEKAIEVLIENFPDEKTGINAYFDQVLNARKKAKESEGQEEISVGKFLDSIINSDDLKLVLLGNLGYFHDDPYSLSLNYYSVAQGSYYSGGGNFIKGGSQKLSDYLANFIIENGGKVILKHLVTEIITENNKAVGVKFETNKKNETELNSAFADDIIANAAIPNVANILLPKVYGENLKEDISKHETGASLLTIYFGFKKPVKGLGNKYYSTFVYDDSVKTQANIKANNKGDFKNRSFTFVDYSQVDSALTSKEKSVGVICCIDYFSDWDKLSKKEYRAKKEEVAEIYIEKLEKLIPGIKNQIEYYEVGTSKTVARYTLNPEGAVYGFAQTPERVKFDKIQSIENLHFASAWTKIGGGFSGAIFSGYLCAMDVLRKNR
ncbi:MAG: NAD(P)/FAD-dependent oxidoreductase [Bacteroidetes bacterium]|nr:MAG: NAD(P)/FAD-dependent oxidoreductase [Bacteroidota bacterium]